MARYSTVLRSIWGDATFRSLSAAPPNGQTLWLRLLTAPELGVIPGVILAYPEGLAAALKWPLEGFREAFREILESLPRPLAKADTKAGLIWLPRAVYHNEPASPNVVMSWRHSWDEVPECDLKVEVYHGLKAYAVGKGMPWSKAFGKAIRMPSWKACPNQEQEQEQEHKPPKSPPPGGALVLLPEEGSLDPVQTVWNHYLERRRELRLGGREPDLTAKRRKHIATRLRSFKVPELLQAVDVLLRPGGWYVRERRTDPELVFRSHEQVEKLLAQAGRPPQGALALASPEQTDRPLEVLGGRRSSQDGQHATPRRPDAQPTPRRPAVAGGRADEDGGA